MILISHFCLSKMVKRKYKVKIARIGPLRYSLKNATHHIVVVDNKKQINDIGVTILELENG